MKNDLLKIISQFDKQSVLVIGDIMIDRFIWGAVNRISPEAPVPIVEINKETETLGGAGNVANNLSAFGAKSYMVGVLGDDITGKSLIDMLKEKSICPDHLVIDTNRPTIIKTRVIAASQQLVRFDKEVKTNLSNSIEQKMIKNIENLIPDMNAVIISDYGKGVIDTAILKKTISLAKAYKIPVLVDPKIKNFKKYKGITVVTPNLKEAIEGMNALNVKTDEDIYDLGKKILKFLKSESVLITRSEKGMTLIRQNNKITNIPTRAKEVYDVTGAGDTVISTMTLALASKADLITAAEIANFAAGLVVAKLGTATVCRQELKEVIAEFYKE
jgi:D-beta-D-heptose 7-phosphate kinase/D-beta-D-heptose 1-phosphate adenosyltransferase